MLNQCCLMLIYSAFSLEMSWGKSRGHEDTNTLRSVAMTKTLVTLLQGVKHSESIHVRSHTLPHLILQHCSSCMLVLFMMVNVLKGQYRLWDLSLGYGLEQLSVSWNMGWIFLFYFFFVSKKSANYTLKDNTDYLGTPLRDCKQVETYVSRASFLLFWLKVFEV